MKKIKMKLLSYWNLLRNLDLKKDVPILHFSSMKARVMEKMQNYMT